jgi:hypothetical protein
MARKAASDEGAANAVPANMSTPKPQPSVAPKRTKLSETRTRIDN